MELVAGDAQRIPIDDFLGVARRVYRADCNDCPPVERKVIKSLRRAEFETRQQVFLVYRHSKCVGRVVARVSAALRDSAGQPVGMLGFFETIDDQLVAARLWDAAVDWLHTRGVVSFVGPIDGDTWHRYRVNNGPFDQPPFLMEPYNPPYYSRLWEQAGWTPLATYHSKRVVDLALAAAFYQEAMDQARQLAYRVQAIDLENYEQELTRLHRLTSEIFADNLMYQPISATEFLALYADARSLIDPRFVTFAVAPSGEDAGFMFCLPDYHRAVTAMRGRSGLAAKLAFLWHRRSATAVNFKSLGVVPAHRRSHVGAALVGHAYAAALEAGYRQANLCLMHDQNPSSQLDAGIGHVVRRYTLYQAAGSQLS